MPSLDIAPATPDRWKDLVQLFERKGPRGGTPVTDGCWCMWWRQRTGNRDRNKRAMAGLVRGGREPGLIAYESGTPVGWVSVGPRNEFGQLVRSRTYGPTVDEQGVFSIVCFYVHPTAKRRGVATELLRAAVQLAVDRGASSVEAYASDPGDYMGARKAFERLGFKAVRPAGKRTVMRYKPRPTRGARPSSPHPPGSRPPGMRRDG